MVKRSSTRVFIAAALLLVVCAPAQAAIKLSLSGIGDPDQLGFGAKGLFLGGKFSSSVLDHPYTNWSWSDVEMTVAENGDATINGNVTRDYHSEVWGVNIQLSDMEFRRPNQSYKRRGNWSGSVNRQSFLDLARGINPFSGTDRSQKTEWGFEWKTLSMSLDKMGNRSSVPGHGWKGFAMPDMGHPLVAELHYDGNSGLTFEAWYKNPHTNSWYDVGDTKTIASLEPSSQVPEPLSVLLMSLGLIGVVGSRRRRVIATPRL